LEVIKGTASNTAKIQRYLCFEVILELPPTETVGHAKSGTGELTAVLSMYTRSNRAGFHNSFVAGRTSGEQYAMGCLAGEMKPNRGIDMIYARHDFHTNRD
jgi:hypothetical protein